MKLEIKRNRKEIFKGYSKILARYHLTYDKFFFGVLRYGAFMVILSLSCLVLLTDAELKLSDYVFLAVCFFGSILIRKRA